MNKLQKTMDMLESVNSSLCDQIQTRMSEYINENGLEIALDLHKDIKVEQVFGIDLLKLTEVLQLVNHAMSTLEQVLYLDKKELERIEAVNKAIDESTYVAPWQIKPKESE